MQITINDANILIDLVELDLLSQFFALNFEFHTTDFVIAELYISQLQAFQSFIDAQKLRIRVFNSEELNNIANLLQSNLSMADCSVLYLAKQNNACLLTGDGNLRKTAERQNIAVKGILFVFDELVIQSQLQPQEAIDKLNQLMRINKRLPVADCNNLLTKWANRITP